jgi:hypothetical protein
MTAPSAHKALAELMRLARACGNIERRHCIGKAQGFEVRDAYFELEYFARAALAAHEAAGVLVGRAGWKLVPTEMTEAMSDARRKFRAQGSFLSHPDVRSYQGIGKDSPHSWELDRDRAEYRAMLAVSPEPPTGEKP